ncbi:MAG: tetratricopeptide repeat protein, partial [Gemmatimonadetes bacterium]|nr:tetratricopeptide repeat protein [Gemmatimonadota bacterium]
IGACMGLFTVWIERNYIGAQGSEFALTFLERTQLAAHNVLFYAGKIVWPSPLTFFYPRWTPDVTNLLQWIPFLVLAGAAAAAWFLRGRIGRGPLATVLLYAGILFPALGFIDVYPFRYSFVADHFQYHAVPVLVSAITILVAGAIGRAGIPRAGGALLLATTAAGLLGIARGEAHTYRNLETLWRDTIEENDTAWMALNNLGQMLAKRGEHGEAIALYEAAIRVKSPYPKAQNNLATSLAAIGRGDQALAQYRAAIEADPANMNARSNLGLALVNAGQIEEGIAVLQDAIAINPRMPSLHTNLGVARARAGNVAGALESFRHVVTLTPADPEAHFRVALTLDRAGDRRGALQAMQEVLRIQPGHAGAVAWVAQNR